MIILANVIFPAFTAPYVSAMFLPVATMAVLAVRRLCSACSTATSHGVESRAPS